MLTHWTKPAEVYVDPGVKEPLGSIEAVVHDEHGDILAYCGDERHADALADRWNEHAGLVTALREARGEIAALKAALKEGRR